MLKPRALIPVLMTYEKPIYVYILIVTVEAPFDNRHPSDKRRTNRRNRRRVYRRV